MLFQDMVQGVESAVHISQENDRPAEGGCLIQRAKAGIVGLPCDQVGTDLTRDIERSIGPDADQEGMLNGGGTSARDHTYVPV